MQVSRNWKEATNKAIPTRKLMLEEKLPAAENMVCHEEHGRCTEVTEVPLNTASDDQDEDDEHASKKPKIAWSPLIRLRYAFLKTYRLKSEFFVASWGSIAQGYAKDCTATYLQGNVCLRRVELAISMYLWDLQKTTCPEMWHDCDCRGSFVVGLHTTCTWPVQAEISALRDTCNLQEYCICMLMIHNVQAAGAPKRCRMKLSLHLSWYTNNVLC